MPEAAGRFITQVWIHFYYYYYYYCNKFLLDYTAVLLTVPDEWVPELDSLDRAGMPS